MSQTTALPVVLVGAGQRAASVFGPILKGPLSSRLQLCALVSRGQERAQALAEELSVPCAASLEDAIQRHGARGAVVCVSSPENHEIAHQVLDLELPALLETPLALDLDSARELALRVRASDVPVEVAEQNPRFPRQAFWRRVIEEGFIGTPRLVSSDRAGYRYHATAVARSLLGRPPGLQASGRRAVFPIDIGRGEQHAAVYTGTISAEHGGIFQVTDGEGLYLADGPWSQGAWSVLGDSGSISGDNTIRSWREGELRSLPIEHCVSTINGVEVTQKMVLHAEGLLESASALPEAALDDDGQAAARCLLDWLDRIDGRDSPTGWSVSDAYEDLAWITALERSALLAGVPVQVPSLD